MKSLLSILFLLSLGSANAQEGNGSQKLIVISNPATSSATKTNLPARLKNAQKAAMSVPDGELVYLCIDFKELETNNLSGVRICNQVWMKKNLDVAKYRNGDPIPKITDPLVWSKLTTGAYCYYNNDSVKYAATYGKLYNWYAINDPRGLAPAGWHIPGIEEWTALETCLTDDKNPVGGSLKETGTSNWLVPNNGATNSSGFKGLPGGFRDFNGMFFFVKNFGYWWSSTGYYNSYAWVRSLNYFDELIGRDGYKQQNGFSVRCIRD